MSDLLDTENQGRPVTTSMSRRKIRPFSRGAVVLLTLVGSLGAMLVAATGSEAQPTPQADAAAQTQAVAAEISRDRSAFLRYAKELERMHDAGLITGGKTTEGDGVGAPVKVLAAQARKRGFSAGAIRLATESAALSNVLTAPLSSSRPGISEEAVASLQSPPALSAFFAAAAANGASGNETAHASGPFGRLRCGWFPNPKPSEAGPWKNIPRSNPADVLRAWGYHPTPGVAGGGWTRPQTWRSFSCGKNTFRDHAYIIGRRTIREQNYTGSPPGEPNPEVWRSGPWPYAEWPAYVAWWHRTR